MLSSATATAIDFSAAFAIAADASAATATASTMVSTAIAQSTGNSAATATANNNGLANAQATIASAANATDNGLGTAVATASDGSSAAAIVGTTTVTSNGNAMAVASDESEATVTVKTPDGFACAFASDSSIAVGSDTAAPTCFGRDAVVVSTGGNCGNAAGTPCAGFTTIELQSYFSNANTTGGQASINITAPIEGAPAGPLDVKEGEICAMIYVFDTAQDLQACCGCPITADGLLTLSISGNLAPNTVGSSSILHDGSIRIVPTRANASKSPFDDSLLPGENCDPATNLCCDPAGRSAGNTIASASRLVAWAQHIQSSQITESEFQTLAPTPVELNGGLPQACADILQLGTGQGSCTCHPGG
jgi:hypothetical protein